MQNEVLTTTNYSLMMMTTTTTAAAAVKQNKVNKCTFTQNFEMT